MTGAIHGVSAVDALGSLRSRVNGLTSAEAEAREREFGPNRLIRTRQRPAIVQLFAQLTHFFALILWTATALALLAEYHSPGSGMRALAGAIVAVILATTTVVYRQATTACLTAIVVAQVANVFACRSDILPASIRGVLRNRLIVTGIGVELALVAAIDYTPLGHAFFATAAIPWMVWLVPVPFAVALIGLDRLDKRRRSHIESAGCR
jgi:magnesium-transporting ATPase (P-type)